MADDESPPESGDSGDGGGSQKKGGLLKDWKGLKGWQKAGVIIGGGALMVAIAMYYKQSQQPSNGAQPSGTAGSYGPSEYPGEGDIYPSVAPTPTGTTAPTPTPAPTGSPTPAPKPPTGDPPKKGPVPEPVPVHTNPIIKSQKPPTRRPMPAPKPKTMPKLSLPQWRAAASKMGVKTNNQGKFVPRQGGYQRAN